MKFSVLPLGVARASFASLRQYHLFHGSHLGYSLISDQQNASLQRISGRWLVHHSHGFHDHYGGHSDRRTKEGENIFRLGLAADIALATGKALTGYVSGSTAVVADAAHSISDVVLSTIALLSFRVARSPRDKDHPYGHGKFETLGSVGISCMLLATGGAIAWHAFDLLLGMLFSYSDGANHSHMQFHSQHSHQHGIDMDHPILAICMTLLSISLKEGLYWLTKWAGERQKSELMKANAWHHRTDALSSVVALVGVGGSILGLKFLDPLAGLALSFMILKAGSETGYRSFLDLVDSAIPEQQLEPMRKTILGIEAVQGCNRMRGRKAGSSLHLDVHIEVDPRLSVSAAHDIEENVRQQIHKNHPEIVEVFVHIDPAVSHQQSNMDAQHLYRVNTAESIAREVLLSNFAKEMVVEGITSHVLQGNVFLQIEVSMSSNLLVKDAIDVAKKGQQQILNAASGISGVSFLLCLGTPA